MVGLRNGSLNILCKVIEVFNRIIKNEIYLVVVVEVKY